MRSHQRAISRHRQVTAGDDFVTLDQRVNHGQVERARRRTRCHRLKVIIATYCGHSYHHDQTEADYGTDELSSSAVRSPDCDRKPRRERTCDIEKTKFASFTKLSRRVQDVSTVAIDKRISW